MSDGFRRLDQYRTFAPELRSVVATLEGGVPGMSLISLTAALSRDFLYDATDSYDLSRTLSLLFSDDGDLQPMRQSCVDLVFRVERLPTSNADLPNDFQRFAGTLHYPSIRRILVHQLPTIAPQTEEHAAFFKFLKAFWKEDRLVQQAVHNAKRLELKVFKDYMAQTEKILQAVSVAASAARQFADHRRYPVVAGIHVARSLRRPRSSLRGRDKRHLVWSNRGSNSSHSPTAFRAFPGVGRNPRRLVYATSLCRYQCSMPSPKGRTPHGRFLEPDRGFFQCDGGDWILGVPRRVQK